MAIEQAAELQEKLAREVKFTERKRELESLRRQRAQQIQATFSSSMTNDGDGKGKNDWLHIKDYLDDKMKLFFNQPRVLTPRSCTCAGLVNLFTFLSLQC